MSEVQTTTTQPPADAPAPGGTGKALTLRDIAALIRWAKVLIVFPLVLASGVLGLGLFRLFGSDEPLAGLATLSVLIAVVILLPARIAIFRLSRRGYVYRLTKSDASRVHLWEPKWKPLTDAMTEAGIDYNRIPVYWSWSNGWEIRTFTRPRVPPYSEVWFVFYPRISRAYLRVEEMPVEAINLTSVVYWACSCFGLFLFLCFVLDLVKPRIGLVVSPATIRAFRTARDKATVILAHELSHVRHRDPIEREWWKSYGWYATVAVPLASLLMLFSFGQAASEHPLPLTLAAVIFPLVLIYALVPYQAAQAIPVLQELRADLEAGLSPSRKRLLLLSLRQSGSAHESTAQRIALLETGMVDVLNRRKRWILALWTLAYAIHCAIGIIIYTTSGGW